MKNDNLSGLSPLWLMSLAMILGTTIVVLIPFGITGGEGIKSSDWISFAGNVLAGVMTLVAAALAWFAVQHQVRAQETSAERARDEVKRQQEVQQAEAKFAAAIVLTQPVHAAAAVFNVTSQVLAVTRRRRSGPMEEAIRPAEIAEGNRKLSSSMRALKATMNHFAIAQAWQDLGIEDRANYLIVTATLHTVITLYDHPPPTGDENTATLHDALAKLQTYLRAFDPELADVYERDSKKK